MFYRMLANHAGDVVTMDVIKYLWKEYTFRLGEELTASSENLKEINNMKESAIDEDAVGSAAALCKTEEITFSC